MQSEVILLSNVKQDNIASLVQKQFEMLGITNIKGKRIDAGQEAIHKTVAESLADYNVIMVIGGMGERFGNMTVSAVSAAIGFNTVLKDGELFPEGAEIFRNKQGRPSGCAVAAGNQCIIMVPGDSSSLQFMLCYRVSQYLAEFLDAPFSMRTLRAEGITKSETEAAIAGSETFGTACSIYEDDGEIAVQVYSRGQNRKDANARTNAAIKSIAEEIGAAAYAIDAENIGQAFGKELSKKDLKAAIAVEGIQRNEMTSAAYTNEYVGNYLGTSQGVTRYDIPKKLLKHHGINSSWTAAVLAGEVSKNYGSNIGIAITTDPMKIGEGANIAVCMGDNVWTEHVSAATREELISLAGKRAVHLARAVVSAYPKLYENSVSLIAAVSGKSKFRTSEAKTKKKWYSRFVPMKGDSKGELIRKSVFIISILVFLGCMGYLGSKVLNSFEQKDLAITLQQMITTEQDVPEDWTFNEKLYGLYEENNDLIGYIQIDGTNVNFPVVQTERENDKGKKGQFYLRKDFYGNYSMYGTPFLDYRCQADPNYQSTNLIIYGHNVYDDGEMFSDLIKYRKLKFYKQHPVIQFDTLYGDKDWLVVGVILTNAYEKDGPVWNYNNFINGTEEGTQEFVNQIAKRTMVVTGVDYNAEDKFLTLSTCSYDFTDARVVIVARQVREGEDISNLDTSKAYYNENPLMPDKWYKAVAQAQKSEADASFGAAENPVSSSSSSSEEISEESSESSSEETSESETSSETSSESSTSSSSSSSQSKSSSSSSAPSSTTSSTPETSSSVSSSESSSSSEEPSSESSSSIPVVSASREESSSSSSSSGSSSSSSSSSQSSSKAPEYSPAPSGSANYSNESGYYERSLVDTVKVNGVTMTVFDAVCQIVAYEAGTGQPDEHVKAQAVATYTYLMYHGGVVSAGTSTAKLNNQIKRCVAEVIGYAVLDDKSNDFILATYFSESCGVTADSKWVWGGSNRNLLSVPSPVDGKTETVKRISSSDFQSKVKSKAGITLSGDPSKWISVSSYFGGTDYVDKVNLGGTSYSARKLRETVLGGSFLRSTAFEVEYDAAKDQFVFTMRGYGHGVGLSAVGSIAYAKQGYEWDEILLKYYSNCYIGFKYP